MENRTPDLDSRLRRLEKANRRLTLLCAASLSVPLLAMAGWKSDVQTQELVRAKRIEVVTDTGVPLVALGPDRTGDGGQIVLRDKLGERRSWWQAGPGSAAFTLTSDLGDDAGANTLGMSVDGAGAKVAIIGPKGSTFSAGVAEDQPRIDLWNAKGANIFAVPFKRGN